MGDLSNGGSTSRPSSTQSDVMAENGQPPRPLSNIRRMSASSRCLPDQPETVFVNPPDPSYMCPVCDQVMRYPVKLGDCGHRCCSGCLVELVRSVTFMSKALSTLATRQNRIGDCSRHCGQFSDYSRRFRRYSRRFWRLWSPETATITYLLV